MGRLMSNTDLHKSSGLARSLEHEARSSAADRLAGVAIIVMETGDRLGGAAQRRCWDPGCVRRQALASVRGRRGGRQLHAWSKTIPKCRSVLRARTPQDGSANEKHCVHHREPRPGKGHRWIATFRRGSFLLSLLTAGGMQPRLCRPERHRLLAGEAELGAIPPHAVEHHADASGQGNGRALLSAHLRQT